MKVKLSKNMKLIAIIVLSLIIITYMFYNSVKEGIGGEKKKRKVVNMRDRNGQVKQIV